MRLMNVKEGIRKSKSKEKEGSADAHTYAHSHINLNVIVVIISLTCNSYKTTASFHHEMGKLCSS